MQMGYPESAEEILAALDRLAPDMDNLSVEVDFEYPDIDFYGIFYANRKPILVTESFIRQSDLLDVLDEVGQTVRFSINPISEEQMRTIHARH